jgi:hypothetical protein
VVALKIWDRLVLMGLIGGFLAGEAGRNRGGDTAGGSTEHEATRYVWELELHGFNSP